MSHGLRIHDGSGIIAADPGVGILKAYGATVPTDGTKGFAPGCLFQDTDAAAGSQVYVNEGTSALCDFNALPMLGARLVNVTGSTLSLTAASHADKLVTINRAAGCAITLPAATGSGARYRVFIGTTITSGSVTITRAGSDTLFGMVYQLADGGSTLAAYECPGSTIITLNGTTTGGIKGDHFTLEDAASGIWSIIGHTSATGTEATPVT